MGNITTCYDYSNMAVFLRRQIIEFLLTFSILGQLSLFGRLRRPRETELGSREWRIQKHQNFFV